jgi:hypothetical protein
MRPLINPSLYKIEHRVEKEWVKLSNQGTFDDVARSPDTKSLP